MESGTARRRICWWSEVEGSALFRAYEGPSNAYKDLLAVHPEQDQPEDHQHHDARHEMLVGRAENLKHFLAEVNFERPHDEAIGAVRQAVGDDGIGADHAERIRPL